MYIIIILTIFLFIAIILFTRCKSLEDLVLIVSLFANAIVIYVNLYKSSPETFSNVGIYGKGPVYPSEYTNDTNDNYGYVKEFMETVRDAGGDATGVANSDSKQGSVDTEGVGDEQGLTPSVNTVQPYVVSDRKFLYTAEDDLADEYKNAKYNDPQRLRYEDSLNAASADSTAVRLQNSRGLRDKRMLDGAATKTTDYFKQMISNELDLTYARDWRGAYEY